MECSSAAKRRRRSASASRSIRVSSGRSRKLRENLLGAFLQFARSAFAGNARTGIAAKFFARCRFDRRLQRGKRHLVATQRAEERLTFQGGDETRFARDDSGLRAAEQFVAAETNQVGAGAQRFAGRRFVFDARRVFPSLTIAPLPRSSTKRNPFLARERGDLRRSKATPTKPLMKKLLRCTLRIIAGLRSQSRLRNRCSVVLFVAPTSRRRAPLASRISPMRKPPPIWTSSPREMITSGFRLVK